MALRRKLNRKTPVSNETIKMVHLVLVGQQVSLYVVLGRKLYETNCLQVILFLSA
jgi:hypothetical protein